RESENSNIIKGKGSDTASQIEVLRDTMYHAPDRAWNNIRLLGVSIPTSDINNDLVKSKNSNNKQKKLNIKSSSKSQKIVAQKPIPPILISYLSSLPSASKNRLITTSPIVDNQQNNQTQQSKKKSWKTLRLGKRNQQNNSEIELSTTFIQQMIVTNKDDKILNKGTNSKGKEEDEKIISEINALEKEINELDTLLNNDTSNINNINTENINNEETKNVDCCTTDSNKRESFEEMDDTTERNTTRETTETNADITEIDVKNTTSNNSDKATEDNVTDDVNVANSNDVVLDAMDAMIDAIVDAIVDVNRLDSTSSFPPQHIVRSIPPTPTTPYFPALTGSNEEPGFPPETVYGMPEQSTSNLNSRSDLEFEPINPFLIPPMSSSTYISPATPLPSTPTTPQYSPLQLDSRPSTPLLSKISLFEELRQATSQQYLDKRAESNKSKQMFIRTPSSSPPTQDHSSLTPRHSPPVSPSLPPPSLLTPAVTTSSITPTLTAHTFYAQSSTSIHSKARTPTPSLILPTSQTLLTIPRSPTISPTSSTSPTSSYVPSNSSMSRQSTLKSPSSSTSRTTAPLLPSTRPPPLPLPSTWPKLKKTVRPEHKRIDCDSGEFFKKKPQTTPNQYTKLMSDDEKKDNNELKDGKIGEKLIDNDFASDSISNKDTIIAVTNDIGKQAQPFQKYLKKKKNISNLSWKVPLASQVICADSEIVRLEEDIEACTFFMDPVDHMKVATPVIKNKCNEFG
ncbi:24037_t:CDS:2, partial [Gigaspora rosea]